MSAKPKKTPDMKPERTKATWPFMAQNRKSAEQAKPGGAGVQGAVQASNALELAPGVFTWDDPQAIARSLKDSAEQSERRRAPAFQSAMSVLTFYINRVAHQLPAAQRACLEGLSNRRPQLPTDPVRDELVTLGLVAKQGAKWALTPQGKKVLAASSNRRNAGGSSV